MRSEIHAAGAPPRPIAKPEHAYLYRQDVEARGSRFKVQGCRTNHFPPHRISNACSYRPTARRWHAGDFFGIWTGFHAEICRGLSDEAFALLP